jgi:signal transduction histidine kinase
METTLPRFSRRATRPVADVTGAGAAVTGAAAAGAGAVAEPFRLTNVAVASGSLFFTVASYFAWAMFRPYVPPPTMNIWVGATGLFMITWYALVIAFLIRKPDDIERRTIWYPAQLYVRIGSNLVVLATIWLFLPFAPRELQLVMTIFYVAHVPTQILALPQRGLINSVGTIVILGSVAVVHLWKGGSYSVIIAAFVLAFAAVMIMLGRAEGTAIEDVLAERRKSEAAAAKLSVAVTEVAAERDAKTRFIATASHDLGQPLQAASLFFEQTLRTNDPAVHGLAVDGVRSAFAAADQLLSHMLNHLRLESDAINPLFAPLSLDPMLARIASQFEPAATAAGISLQALPTRIRLETDRALLDRALGNLVDNAIRHSRASRVVIAARRNGGNRMRLWVLDNGRGVAATDADYIFNDYFQGVETKAAATTGFGLGLSSVRRISILLKGEAGLDRRWRSGAAFFLDLPMAPAPRGGVR